MTARARAALFAVLFAVLSVGMGSTGRGEEALATTAAVRRLSAEEAARQRPVRVAGVLTWFAAGVGGEAVVHDEAGGVYVRLSAAELGAGLAAGERVEIEGVTAPGGYAPIIHARAVRRVGPGKLPPAIAVTLEDLQTGAFDSQRVEVRGVVQVAVLDHKLGGCYLRVATPCGRFGANYRAAPGFDPKSLIDAEVRVRGVCFPFFNPRRELLGVRLAVPFPEDVSILSPPPSWDDVPLTPLDRLLPFSPAGTSLHRRRVQGVVTFARPGDYFCLQEGMRALRVHSLQPGPLAVGDRVEAFGFVDRENFFAELVEGAFVPFGRTAPPEPADVRPEDVRAGDFDARLVRLAGELRRTTAVGSEQRFFLEAEGQLFEAVLDPPDADAAQWREGSLLRATGVLNAVYRGRPDRPQFPEFAGFRLQLRSPADLVLVRAAPWWTEERLLRALAALGVVLLAAFAWVQLLRRRVERRTAQLGAEIRARHHSRVEYEATLRERSRLAGDLHDTVEQAFTAMSFQFQTARALRELDAPRAEHHLGLAEEFLSRSRDELRRSVWDLRTQVLEGRTLGDALRHHAAQVSGERTLRCEVIVEGEKPLPDLVAGHLFLFAQEALNNALKHARARRITLRLTTTAEEVQLVIEDDGCGFDPARVPGPAAGHFGLTGLRERIHRIDGQLQLQSTVGQGTRLRARVPLEAGPEAAAPPGAGDDPPGKK